MSDVAKMVELMTKLRKKTNNNNFVEEKTKIKKVFIYFLIIG